MIKRIQLGDKRIREYEYTPTAEELEAELADHKNTVAGKLDAQMENLLRANGFVTSVGIKMDAAYNSVIKFRDGIQYAQRDGLTEIAVIDYDNAAHIMTVTQADALLTEVGRNYWNHYYRKQTIRLNIAAAETKEAVDAAINWEGIV